MAVIVVAKSIALITADAAVGGVRLGRTSRACCLLIGLARVGHLHSHVWGYSYQ